MDYTCVVSDDSRFGGNGESCLYKMWYSNYDSAQERNVLRYASSDDGINWREDNSSILGELYSGDNDRPIVLYDEDRFGEVDGPLYKLWYWTGAENADSIGAIHYAGSEDGIIWYGDRAIEQSSLFPLVTGDSKPENPSYGDLKDGSGDPGDWFYHLQGPGYIIYNEKGGNLGSETPLNRDDDEPLSYRYVMYYDSASEGSSPDGSKRQIALAYSTDGLVWIRYGDQPVIVPGGDSSDWDGLYAYRSNVIMLNGLYHMWYAGAAGDNDAQGIGHGTSPDGINWVLDDTPLAHVQDNESWRISRTGAPWVIAENHLLKQAVSSTDYKLWAVGEDIAGDSAIGYWETAAEERDELPGVEDLLPSGTGTMTDWTPYGESSNWECARTNDGDVSYVHSSTEWLTDRYQMEDLTTSAAQIDNVVMHAYARKAVKQSLKIYLGIRSGGVDSLTRTSLGNTYADYTTEWATDPATGQPWTTDAVNAIEAVVNRESNHGREARVTQTYLTVYYTEIATPTPAAQPTATPEAGSTATPMPTPTAGSGPVNIADDNWESGDFSGGSGWMYDWYHSGNADVISITSPHQGQYHLRIRSNDGYVDRSVDVTGYRDVHVSFWAKAESFERDETATFTVSTDDQNWYTLQTWANGDDDGVYRYYDFDLSSLGISPSDELLVAFDAEMSGTGDRLLMDEIVISGIAVVSTPTPQPTATPTAQPTATPTAQPTETPSPTPTTTPAPTFTPTPPPTIPPTPQPTATPTAEPTTTPTAEPTTTPTAEPTTTPTVEPTTTPPPPTTTPTIGDPTPIPAPTPVNVALGKPAVASGSWGNPFTANRVTDGSITETEPDYWLLPNNTIGWIRVDLLDPFFIDEIRWLNTHNSGSNDRGATDWRMMASKDGVGYTEIASGTEEFSENPSWVVINGLPEEISYRYLRLLIDGYHNRGGGINEIEVVGTLDNPGVPNVALGKTVTASATHNPSSSPDHVVDGSYFEEEIDYWLLPDYTTGWVEVDLEDIYDVSKIRWLNTHNAGYDDRAATDWRIELSIDGTTFTEYTRGSEVFSPTPAWVEFKHISVTARYLRLYVDS
ncbi:MAG: discoidin domain-containing protein, partial [Methanoculleaceae archaeon]